MLADVMYVFVGQTEMERKGEQFSVRRLSHRQPVLADELGIGSIVMIGTIVDADSNSSRPQFVHDSIAIRKPYRT